MEASTPGQASWVFVKLLFLHCGGRLVVLSSPEVLMQGIIVAALRNFFRGVEALIGCLVHVVLHVLLPRQFVTVLLFLLMDTLPSDVVGVSVVMGKGLGIELTAHTSVVILEEWLVGGMIFLFFPP